MADQTLLAKARIARFNDLPNFSGHPSEDAEQFLKSIKSLTKANDESDNPEILEIVRGKLTKSAGIWFDNHEFHFKKWLDFETAFRNRYFSTTMNHNKYDPLKQRKQLHDEPIASYFNDIVKLCREIDPNMSEQVIIQHLMNGINTDFRKELSRLESHMNTLNECLKYAKIEQDRYDTREKSRNLSLQSQQSTYTSRVSTHLAPVREELTTAEKEKIHNRSCTLRQRQRNYHYEIIRRDMDRRFTIKRIKTILRQYDIPFSAINVSRSTMSYKTSLHIGIRDPSKIQTYEDQTRHLFTTKHYDDLKPNQHQSHSPSRHNRHGQY